jgi:hypothetical protein
MNRKWSSDQDLKKNSTNGSIIQDFIGPQSSVKVEIWPKPPALTVQIKHKLCFSLSDLLKFIYIFQKAFAFIIRISTVHCQYRIIWELVPKVRIIALIHLHKSVLNFESSLSEFSKLLCKWNKAIILTFGTSSQIIPD